MYIRGCQLLLLGSSSLFGIPLQYFTIIIASFCRFWNYLVAFIWYKLLEDGNIERLAFEMINVAKAYGMEMKAAYSAVGYFVENKERMRYADFIAQGFFIGSGVIEAGCKAIVTQRLKMAGMRWTVNGANNIIALRCKQLSGRIIKRRKKAA